MTWSQLARIASWQTVGSSLVAFAAALVDPAYAIMAIVATLVSFGVWVTATERHWDL